MNLIQGLRILLRSSMVLRWLSLTPELDGEQVALIYNGLLYSKHMKVGLAHLTAIRYLVIMARSPK